MSKFNMETITCPECKTEQKIKIWEDVNISLNPKEKDKIISGDFFKFKCKKCGFEAPLTYNCLYSDADSKLVVWLLPQLTEENKSEIENTETFKNQVKNATKEYVYRIVTTPNELKEKILLHNAGIDDRIVELLKMVYVSQLEALTGDKKIASEPITEMFFESQGEEKYSLIIFFQNREPIMVPVNYNVYTKLKEDFIDLINEEDFTKFREIDSQWARGTFVKKNKNK